MQTKMNQSCVPKTKGDVIDKVHSTVEEMRLMPYQNIRKD
jgi:hypothetical protein